MESPWVTLLTDRNFQNWSSVDFSPVNHPEEQTKEQYATEDEDRPIHGHCAYF